MRRAAVFLSLGAAALIGPGGWTLKGQSSIGMPVEAAAAIVVTAAPSPITSDPMTFGDGCYVCGSIASNFNGTPIPKWSYVWFNAVVNVKGLNGGAGVVHFTEGNIQFKSGGIDYWIDLPPANIVFSDGATEATTDFDCDARVWTTTVPMDYSGNVFLSGVARSFSDGLPGGINPVTVSGSFSSALSGLSFTWKWAAAAYSVFSDCEDDLGVKPIDGSKMNPYNNSDHAGTPENFKSDVIGGARGGGGSNWTGSYSGTSTAKCD
jgi:hypothetical protein